MGYALYKLSKEDAAIFVKLTEKCWNGKERDLTKLNKYERAVLLKLMDEAGEYNPGEKPVKKANPYHDPKTGRFAPAPGGTASKYPAEQLDKLRGLIESGASFSAIKQRKAMGMSKEEYDEFRNTVKPPKQVEQKPKKARPEAKKPENEAEDSYRMRHRPDKMGSGHDITDAGMMPNDFYDHPEQYATTGDKSYKESIKALQAIRNKPDAEVTIYRAAPKEEFNDGDWVTLSRTYAETHAQSNSRENNQLQVYSKKVRAKDIQFAGDDINEFGYYPVDGVAKSFSDVIQKFNPYHDPKTGRFTSAKGGSGGMVMNATADKHVSAELLEELGLPANYNEIKAKRKASVDKIKEALPGVKVQLLAVDADVLDEIADTIVTVAERYPNCKEAFSSFLSSDDGERTFEENPTAIAFYSPNTKSIRLNPKYFSDKAKLESAYNEDVKKDFHPKGTDYRAVVAHEMGHAIDHYLGQKVNFGDPISDGLLRYHKKRGFIEAAGGVESGLSKYATFNDGEYFAEGFAELINSKNPRPLAKHIGDRISSELQNLAMMEELVAKSFFEVIRKFNKWHDPKTGRFTSAPGGSAMTTEQKLASAKAKIEETGAYVVLDKMDGDVALAVADTITKVSERYPDCKRAICGITTAEPEQDMFKEGSKVMAAYDPFMQRIHLNPNYFGDKEKFETAYNESVEKGFHPKDTDYMAIVVHEMGHALDHYYGKELNNGSDVSINMRRTHDKMGITKGYFGIKEGLSEYATVNSGEYVAEGFAEYINSPNPRPIAKAIGQTMDRYNARMNEVHEKREAAAKAREAKRQSTLDTIASMRAKREKEEEILDKLWEKETLTDADRKKIAEHGDTWKKLGEEIRSLENELDEL